MKIVVTEPEYFPKKFTERIATMGTVVSKRFTREELLSEIEDTDILIVRIETMVDRTLLERARKLRVIASLTTGLDHIDTEYAKSKGIIIVNVPGLHTTSTAEYTMSLLMSLARKVPWAFEDLKTRGWNRHAFIGNELNGKTLGIIGLGRIGSRVAKYATAFGMKVIFNDPFADAKIAKESGATQVDLKTLFSQSDFITIHAFLSKDTENLISGKQLEMMKRTAFLINASRGKIVNEDDLLNALSSGKIAGAALDVFDEEPLGMESKLVSYASSHNNLLITPHIAGSTWDSIEAATQYVLGEIDSILKSK